jgi:hypothetical protein
VPPFGAPPVDAPPVFEFEASLEASPPGFDVPIFVSPLHEQTSTTFSAAIADL